MNCRITVSTELSHVATIVMKLLAELMRCDEMNILKNKH